MTDISSQEQCIAVTNSGERCKRIAKDGKFCYQHDDGDEIVEIETSEGPRIVNWLSAELEQETTKVSGVKQDIYLNIADAQEGLHSILKDVRHGDTSPETLFSHLDQVVDEVGGDRGKNTVFGALVGGIAGIPGGPVGIWAGIVAGSSVGFWVSEKDDRGVLGFLVSDVPEDAKVVSSDHNVIADIEPIQLVIQSTIEEDGDDWVRETQTRAWDMDEVENALSQLPKYEADQHPPGGYYVRDPETDSVVVLIFGEPEEELSL